MNFCFVSTRWPVGCKCPVALKMHKNLLSGAGWADGEVTNVTMETTVLVWVDCYYARCREVEKPGMFISDRSVHVEMTGVWGSRGFLTFAWVKKQYETVGARPKK
jgi:hypothetical protein